MMISVLKYLRNLRRCFVLVLMLVLVSCSGSREMMDLPEDPNLLAVYDGGVVTADEFTDRYSRSTLGTERDELAAYRDFLERYVNFKIKVLDARSQGRDNDPEIVSELETYREQLARPYLVERVIMDSLARDLYEKQKVELKVGHILKRVLPYAAPEDTLAAFSFMQAVRDSLVDGADFEAMAWRHSEDQTAKRNSGVLGYITGGRLIYSFEKVAYETEVGSLSPVFRTDFGYHIIKVFDERESVPEISASHILVSTGQRDSTAALARMDSVLAGLDAGTPFAELAREYSDDAGSAQRGGALGTFGRGRMVPPFEEAAYALESIGDVSDVVKTRFGYHIIQLTGKEEKQSFDDVYEELKASLARMPRVSAAELIEGGKFRKAAGSSLDLAALDSVLSTFGSTDSLYHRFLKSDAEVADFAFVGDSSYSLSDFRTYLRGRRLMDTPRSTEHFEKLANEFLDQIGFDYAVSTLADRDPEFGRLMSEYEEGILLFAISEDSVWNPASSDSAGLAKLYEQHRDTLWYPERRRIVGFQTRVDSAAQLVVDTLDSELPLREVIEIARDHAFDMRIDTTFIADSTFSVYDNTLDLDIGQHTGLLQTRSGKMVLLVDGVEGPREKTFQEARADLVSMHQEAIEGEWIDRLRERYRVRMFPERLPPLLESSTSSL